MFTFRDNTFNKEKGALCPLFVPAYPFTPVPSYPCINQISSTERLRNSLRAAPFSMPFCRSAKSMSWCTTLLSLA